MTWLRCDVFSASTARLAYENAFAYFLRSKAHATAPIPYSGSLLMIHPSYHCSRTRSPKKYFQNDNADLALVRNPLSLISWPRKVIVPAPRPINHEMRIL